ncbi:MAG: nucleotide pyrophosphohydrolase [Methanobacteriota archaeon]|nr:MAG: nucleotide pyrophosphohydrolase [Euryarchaeota archaeon]
MVDVDTTIAELRERVRAFVHARDWESFHTPKDLAIALSVEASELVEPFLWRETSARLSAEDRASVGEELADVIIYGLSLANVLDLDLSEAVLDKLRKDERKYPARRFRGRAP